MLAGDPAYLLVGLGEIKHVAHLHRFKSLQLPIGTALNPHLGVYDGSFNVLGDDFLSHNRVWISYPLHRLYVQAVPTPK